MRWQLDFGGKFDRYVDADELRDAAYGGWEFVRHTSDSTGFVVVCAISWEVKPYCRITPVPTFRMTGGPKDGQVCAAPDKVPEHIHFQYVVALGDDGDTLAPVPPHRLRELSDTYVHHPFDCPCCGTMRGVVEHVYVWPETLHKQIARRGEIGAGPVPAAYYPDPIPREDQDYDGARRPHGPRPDVPAKAVRPATETGDDA